MVDENGGGLSELARFMNVADEACAEAYALWHGPMKHIEELDSLFVEFAPLLAKATPPTSAILILNAHASLRAAIRLALSGQLVPAFMALRGGLESALYANAMVVDNSLESIWLHRDKDVQSKNACRNTFTVKNVLGMLASAQDQDFSDRVKEAYDATIDFGAHPNSRSLVASIHLEETATQQVAVTYGYIHGAKSKPLRQSLLACAEVGLQIFFIAMICMQHLVDVPELNARANVLLDALPKVAAELGAVADEAP
jgi:hypothetical protein